MIIGIEGTGSQGWDQFDLRRTFVRKVLEQNREHSKFYFIGPNNEGSDGDAIVKGAWKQLYVGGMIDSKIILVGYSRGAAYCMKLAEMWQKTWGDAKPIDMLVMFDAVARNKYSDSWALTAKAWKEGWTEVVIPEAIPASVSVALHAVRHPQAGSRAGFGNVGLSVQDRTKTGFKIKQFMCSHGAMGGTSYDAKAEEGIGFVKTYAIQGDTNWLLNSTMPADSRYKNAPKYPVTNKHDDDVGMQLVGRWMWDLMKKHGVLSSSADFARNALPFTGSRVPGEANVVQ